MDICNLLMVVRFYYIGTVQFWSMWRKASPVCTKSMATYVVLCPVFEAHVCTHLQLLDCVGEDNFDVEERKRTVRNDQPCLKMPGCPA